jgi:hypothetical protein
METCATWQAVRLAGVRRGALSFPVGWSPVANAARADLRNNSDIAATSLTSPGGVRAEPHDEQTVFAPGRAARRPGFYRHGRRAQFDSRFYDLAARYDWVETPEHDVTDVTLSDDGRMLAWLVNEDGYERLYPATASRERSYRSRSRRRAAKPVGTVPVAVRGRFAWQ